ncbi:hypothetical protein [Bacillus sp. T3]|uniref:hypothetical protein n=1 Tax=Bacillus sp. T3 TaxID=467262 RepID=UPI002982ACA3|nr:hypothetical protein [Bacillus sp. T3]
MIKSPTAHEISYGLVELNPDGTIQRANEEAKRLLISEESDTNYLFHRINNNEIKTKLHECFMGRANEFIVTIDNQPVFFYFIAPTTITMIISMSTCLTSTIY